MSLYYKYVNKGVSCSEGDSVGIEVASVMHAPLPALCAGTMCKPGVGWANREYN